MRKEWLDDDALRAAVGDWVAGEDAQLFALTELLKSKNVEGSPEGRQRARRCPVRRPRGPRP